MEDKDEMERQALLVQSLEGNEAFRIWRKDMVDPIIELLEMKLARSEEMSEAMLRGNILAKYILKDIFYDVFSRLRASNQQNK